MDRIHKVHILERTNLPKEICGLESGLQRFKQLPDLIL